MSQNFNTCEICSKNFKRPQDLKTHIKRFHTQNISVSTIAQISTQSETQFQPIDEIDICQPVFEIINDEYNSINFEIVSESSNENNFDISQYTENISTNKCVLKQHCETCSCFKESIQIDQIGGNKKILSLIDYPISQQLPSEKVRDICLKGDKILETNLSDQKIFRDIQFNHYFSPEISDRITKNNFKFEKRSLNSYKKQEKQSNTYLNFQNGLTDYEAVMKYTIENDINFCAENFNPTMIGYDCEAFHPTDKNIIPTHLNGGVISMICATFSRKNQIEKFVVYILDQYQYDEIQINEFVKARRNELGKYDQFELIIKQSENQSVMACKFLDDVNDCGVSLLYGFNSSATCQKDTVDKNGNIKKAQIGYDLPFIIHISGRETREEIEHGAKLFGKIGKQIKRISWLPNCYILDCMIIFQNDRYFVMQQSDMPNKSLNSFLKAAKLPLKEDDQSIIQRMEQMRFKNSDQTDCINYCLWDSYSLTQVMNIIKYVDNIKAYINIFNIPLSWALHKNVSNWITMDLFRYYFKGGIAFSYAKYELPKNRPKFRGATTEQCPVQYLKTVISWIAMHDFTGLYPNCIIACNIGIDSLLGEDDDKTDAFKINLNFVDPYLVEAVQNKIQKQESVDITKLSDEEKKVFKKNKVTKQELELLESHNNPHYVYFSKKQSIFVKRIQEILNKRIEIKKDMKNKNFTNGTYEQLDARQNAVKIFVNTIYGLSGADTFQLSDGQKIVARACTAVARKLTYFARQSVEELQIGQVVFRDTDSCGTIINKQNIGELREQTKKLNILVNKKLHDEFGTNHTVDFLFEEDNFQLKTYYPEAKKAYARIECKYQDIIENKPLQQELKIKGVSWSLMSEYGKEFFRHHTEYILLNFETQEQIQQYIYKVLNDVQKDIAELIHTKNFSELQRKYHKQIKNSDRNITAKYLRKTFKITENEVQILPIVKNSKLKSNCVIPCQYANKFEIDQNQVLEWFISPFQKFFGKHEYIQTKYDVFEQIIECRLATEKIGYNAKTQQYSITDILENIDSIQTKISFNEIVKPVNKLFFDLDNTFNELNFQLCLQEIETMISKFQYSAINIDYAYTKSTSKNKPHSYHVVYQIRSSLALNRYIAQQINQKFRDENKFESDIIDIDVYSLNKSLRLPNSPKCDTKNKTLEQVYHIVKQGNIQQMLISDIESVQNILSNAIGFIQNRHKEIGYQFIQTNQKYINEIMQYLPFPVTFKEQQKGCIEIKPVKMPYDCPVCKRKHDSLGLKVYLRNDGFTLNCWSQSNPDKKPITHKFEKVDKIKKQNNRILQLKEYTKMKLDYSFSRLDQTNIEFQHNKDVQYNLNAQTTFVRSQMMTGKTKQQIKLVEEGNFKTILALSFRRTFARDNSSKNKFINYEEIQGQINLIDYPRLMLQVDSLAKLDLSVKPSLLIIDEIESTIEQLLAIPRDTQPYIIYKFIQLLQQSEKILCLDAELEQSTVECITQLSNSTNYKLFVNTFQPKTDSKIVVHDYVQDKKGNKNISKVINQILQIVNQNKRVVVFCTSIERAKDIRSQMPDNKKIKYYDGEDARKIDGKSQAKIKAEDFADVNKAWEDCDILIYTGTLTAGISFELERFDQFVGLYVNQSGTPLGFTQGLHRVRNFADKIGYLYLENSAGYKPETAYDITENATQIYGHTDLCEVSQLKNWVEASTNQSQNNRLKLVIRNLQNMGYQLEIQENSVDSNQSKEIKQLRPEQFQEIVDAKITLEDIEKIPKILKQSTLLINDTDEQLQAKYNKIRLFKSFYLDRDEKSIQHINSLDAEKIKILYQERPRIHEGHKIRILIEKQLSVRPEFKDLQLEQMDQMIKACQIESKQNLRAELASTVSKDTVLRFHQKIYIIQQAIKVRQLLTDLNQQTLQKAVEEIQKNKTLINIGFTFGRDGVHNKLNEILKHIDQKIIINDSKRVMKDGKKITENTYSITCISAQTILESLDQIIQSKQKVKKHILTDQ